MLATKHKPKAAASPAWPDAVQMDWESEVPATEAFEDYTIAQWQQVIDKLMRWRGNPAELQDEGLDAPSVATIDRAIGFARRNSDQPEPMIVVPDPNGGIVFERRENGTSEELHFWDDGEVEYLRFHGTQVVERRKV